MRRMIYNGIPWYDQNGDTVNAHGACILQEGERYYLYGEYKTDDINQYMGFSCYSTENFTDWRFEGFALPPLKEGLLGPGRVGERVKVLKSRATGRYSMLMHTDDSRYCDPCIGLAVGEYPDKEFQFQGPLLFKGEPVRLWDMGTFVDEDDTAYLLTHEGNIYRLDDTYTEAVELVAANIAPGGESPAMFKKDGVYYLMLSNKTSWERNDNYYFTAKDLHGPWSCRGLFCPEKSLTFNTQCSFVFQYERDNESIPVYVGDRWSFPRQASAATLVLLPVETGKDGMRISRYLPAWSPDTLEEEKLEPEHCLDFCSNVRGEEISLRFQGNGITVFGNTDCHGGYGNIRIYDEKGRCVHETSIDFYSGVSDRGMRYRSPVLAEGNYVLKLAVAGENSVCATKSGKRYGSDDYYVHVTGWTAD